MHKHQECSFYKIKEEDWNDVLVFYLCLFSFQQKLEGFLISKSFEKAKLMQHK